MSNTFTNILKLLLAMSLTLFVGFLALESSNQPFYDKWKLTDTQRIVYDEALTIALNTPTPTLFSTRTGSPQTAHRSAISSMRFDAHTGEIQFLITADYAIYQSLILTYREDVEEDYISSYHPFLTIKELRTKDLVWK